MKIILNIFVFIFILFNLGIYQCFSQIGINTDDPNPSSVLHVFSTNRGILIPGLSRGELISNPADGLLIYNTSTRMFDFYNKSTLKWQPISPFSPDNTGYKLGSTNTLTLDGTLYVKDTLSELRGFGTVPIGGIIMWSGTNIPTGWALCDGRVTPEGITTPDLRGRFIVGAGITNSGMADPSIWDNNYYVPGNLSNKGVTKGRTGGIKLPYLLTTQLPAHFHAINLISSAAGEHVHPYITAESDGNFSPYLRAGTLGAIMNHVSGYYVTYDSASHQTKHIDIPRAISGNQMDAVPNHSHLISGTTALQGSGAPLENRPPYYVLAYIMRVR